MILKLVYIGALMSALLVISIGGLNHTSFLILWSVSFGFLWINLWVVIIKTFNTRRVMRKAVRNSGYGYSREIKDIQDSDMDEEERANRIMEISEIRDTVPIIISRIYLAPTGAVLGAIYGALLGAIVAAFFVTYSGTFPENLPDALMEAFAKIKNFVLDPIRAPVVSVTLIILAAIFGFRWDMRRRRDDGE